MFKGCIFDMRDDGTLVLTAEKELGWTHRDYIYDNFPECKKLVVNKGVIEIRNQAFEGCGFEEVILPNTITSIGNRVFGGCSDLKTITIPASVVSIGDSAFSDCKNLKSVIIPDSVTSIGVRAFEFPYTTIYGRKGSYAEKYAEENGLTFVDKDAGEKTDNTIIVRSGNIGDDLFFTVESNGVLTISGNGDMPKNINSSWSGYPSYKKNITSVIIKNGVTNICDNAFEFHASLETITIPESVTSIGSRAFSTCSSLKTITIPDSVTSIDAYAFYDCTALESVELPNSFTSIGNSAFEKCSSLKNIKIPDNVTSIGKKAFELCQSLEKIIIPPSVISIESYAFDKCDLLRIYGYKDSYAQQYAGWLKIPFVDIESGEVIGETTTTTTMTTTTTSTTSTTAPVTNTGSTTSGTQTTSAVQTGESGTSTTSTSATTVTGTSEPELTPDKIGDLDGDGKAIATDAALLLKLYAELSSGSSDATTEEIYICDVNRNGKIEAGDAAFILKYYAEASGGYDKTIDVYLKEVLKIAI